MIPRIKFANLPTPIEPMPRLSSFMGGPNLWIKRDDLTGLALGGNKIRKLEYVLAEVMANEAKTVISVGGVQSNHCRQTAALCAKVGLRCILVLSGEEPARYSGNLLLDKLFGAEIVWCDKNERDQAAAEIFEHELKTGNRPYFIPLGASTPTGAAGYIHAIDEMIQQDVIIPDWIVLASASAGTQAGMVLGVKSRKLTTRILGISIDPGITDLVDRISTIANGAGDKFGEKCKIGAEDIFVNTDYHGGGYAVMGEFEVNAIKLFARTEGILLGPVYTGRAAAGMLDLIRKGFFRKDEKVLFWHTGDTPTLFADPYACMF